MAASTTKKQTASSSKQAKYARRQQSLEAEIGPPPLTSAQKRKGTLLRKKTRRDLLAWNRLVFPNSSGLKPLGKVQIDSIKHDESVILNGGRICKAEPRGYGKTTRSCNAALWATLNGYRDMAPIFSANLGKSKTQIMARWKAELYGNDLLFWMYPELIWPLRALENKPQRCASQTYKGKPTHVQWTSDRIVLPWITGNAGAGACLIALPLASCRGATHTRPDGKILRPDLVFLDDVQKDEDAANPNTVRKLEDLIDHTAMMLGGHSKSMSAIMACTVREEEDLSETYLSKVGWRRVRYKMLEVPPEKEKELWLGKYADLRRAYNPEDPDDQLRAQRESLQFYLENREEMDRGAVLTWDWAYQWDDDEPLEVSALQHAYNILIDLGDDVFSCECQNQPKKIVADFELLTATQIDAKSSGRPRNVVPNECTTLTCHVDVHPEILYWDVWGWEPGFTGYRIDDGVLPEQRRRVFAHRRIALRLSERFPGFDMESRVMAGLNELMLGKVSEQLRDAYPSRAWYEGLLERFWVRQDGVPLTLSLALIDASGEASDTVKKFITLNKLQSRVMPSFGRGIGAKDAPISAWRQSQGKGDGPEWVKTRPKPGDPLGVVFDTNYWKTKWHRAMAMPEGARGALFVYDAQEGHHLQLGEHANAETPTLVVVGRRRVYEWTAKPNRDNHEFDVAVGAMVAASVRGIRSVDAKPPEKSISLAALQRLKRR